MVLWVLGDGLPRADTGDHRMGAQGRHDEKDPEDHAGDQERRNERGQHISDEEGSIIGAMMKASATAP
jgi:hypothetical protein